MKMKNHLLRSFLLFLPFTLFLGASPCNAQETGIWKIFILHSYEQNHICGQPQHDGVVTALKNNGFTQGKNFTLKTYHMDTKQKNNTPELINEQAKIALDQIKKFKPHILVTLDDNAFRTVALELADTPIHILFSGMNGQPETYNQQKTFMNSREKPGHNITGVYEKLHISDALRIQQKIFPNLRKVRMLTDLSPTGKAITRQVEIELNENKLPVEFDVKTVKSFEEYQKEINIINNSPEIGTIYPVALLLKDGAGKTYTAPDIFRWTIKNCDKPAIALNYAFTHLGLFGGAAVDFKAMGLQVGEMAAKILRGENPGNISIEDAERYALVFNLARTKQLGINIPEDILLAADEIVTEKTN